MSAALSYSGSVFSTLPSTSTEEPSWKESVDSSTAEEGTTEEDATYGDLQLTSDRDQVEPAIKKLITAGRLCGAILSAEESRVGVALQEALLNAIIHGNLEVASDLRETDSLAFERLISLRRIDPKYGGRIVRVEYRAKDGEISYMIEDEGPGFDVDGIPDPCDEEHIFRCSGRGVLLMRTLMDSVVYNDRGNRVTLTKRHS